MSAPTRTRRTPAATTGRFSRPGAGGRSTATARRSIPSRRPTSTQRRAIAGGWLQRRQPQKQSGMQRVLGGVTGALPGLSKKGSSSKVGRTGKAGGLALLAGVAGLAFKNRDKVASLARRDSAGNDFQTAPATPTPVPPVSTTPSGSGTTGLSTGSAGTGTSPIDGNPDDPQKP
jgi:hypothetical protein